VYFSPNIIGVNNSRKMRWAGHVTGMGEKKNTYRILVGPLGKRRSWEKIKTYLKERVQEVVRRLHVAAESKKRWLLVNVLKELSVTIQRGKFLDYLKSYKLHKRDSSSMALVSQPANQLVGHSLAS
jgi:hypothetical protein